MIGRFCAIFVTFFNSSENAISLSLTHNNVVSLSLVVGFASLKLLKNKKREERQCDGYGDEEQHRIHHAYDGSSGSKQSDF